MSDWIMLALTGQYLLLAIATGCEHRWPLSCYWSGATILNVGVYLLGRNT